MTYSVSGEKGHVTCKGITVLLYVFSNGPGRCGVFGIRGITYFRE